MGVANLLYYFGKRIYNRLVLIRLGQSVLILLLAVSIQLQCDFACLTSLVQPSKPATAAPPCHHQADSEQAARHESNPENKCDRHATGDQVVITAKASGPAPAFVAIPVATPPAQLMTARLSVSEHAGSESPNSSRIEPPLRI